MEIVERSTNRIYEVAGLGKFSNDFDLKRQIRRALISILSNIAEGFERRTNNEFVHYLFIAKGSAGEVRSQLYLANDLGYLHDNDFEELYEQNRNNSKSLSGFIKYLRAS